MSRQPRTEDLPDRVIVDQHGHYWRDQIVNGHGAMVALVGCAEYGCHVAA